MRVLIALVCLLPAALAQPAQDSLLADSFSARPATVDSSDAMGITAADSLAAPSDSLAVLPDSTARQPEAAPPRAMAAMRAAAARMAEPVEIALGAAGPRLTLPPGWDGPVEVNESRLPASASYAATNRTPGHPLVGTEIRIERATGLNQLVRERWLRGQVAQGYHGLTPVGPYTSPLGGLGLEVAGDDRTGVVVFVQRDGALWAIHVSAPAAVWASRRTEVIGLLADVAL